MSEQVSRALVSAMPCRGRARTMKQLFAIALALATPAFADDVTLPVSVTVPPPADEVAITGLDDIDFGDVVLGVQNGGVAFSDSAVCLYRTTPGLVSLTIQGAGVVRGPNNATIGYTFVFTDRNGVEVHLGETVAGLTPSSVSNGAGQYCGGRGDLASLHAKLATWNNASAPAAGAYSDVITLTVAPD